MGRPRAVLAAVTKLHIVIDGDTVKLYDGASLIWIGSITEWSGALASGKRL